MIECSDVDNLPNGVFTYQPNDKKLVNTTATYECNPGFYLVGISVRTCTEEKTWVPVLPTMCGESLYNEWCCFGVLFCLADLAAIREYHFSGWVYKRCRKI